MVIKNFMKTCSSRKKLKIFTDFHVFTRESESDAGNRIPTPKKFKGVGVGSRIKNIPTRHPWFKLARDFVPY